MMWLVISYFLLLLNVIILNTYVDIFLILKLLFAVIFLIPRITCSHNFMSIFRLWTLLDRWLCLFICLTVCVFVRFLAIELRCVGKIERVLEVFLYATPTVCLKVWYFLVVVPLGMRLTGFPQPNRTSQAIARVYYDDI